MTSKSSFSDQCKNVIRQSLPVILGSFVILFLYHVMGVLLCVGSVISGNEAELFLGESLHSEKLLAAELVLGARGPGPMLTLVLSVLFGIRAFSYLQKQQTVDLMESLPVKRRSLFFRAVLQYFLIYAFSMIVTRMLGFLLAAGLGAVSGTLFLEMVIQILRDLVFYLACNALVILAVNLTGTGVVALLAVLTLFLYEFLIRGIMDIFGDFFYRTGCYDFYPPTSVLTQNWSSPVENYLRGSLSVPSLTRYVTGAEAAGTVFSYLREGFLPYDLQNILLFLLFLGLAYLAFSRRKVERAGRAVVFRPVEIAVKLCLCIPGAMLFGGLVYMVMGQRRYGLSLWLCYIFLVVAAFLLAGIMEMIFRSSFQGFFRHGGEIVLVMALSVLCFSSYAFDLTGYDHYLPKKGVTESVAIFPDNYQNYVDGSGEGIPLRERMREMMSYQEVDGVRRLLREKCIIDRNGINLEGNSGDTYESTFPLIFFYRNKNGSVARRERFSYSMDGSLLDPIIGSETYKKAMFQLEGYPYTEEHARLCSVNYKNFRGQDRSEAGNLELLQEFAAAYQEDLKQYDYSFASTHSSIGTITIEGEQSVKDVYQKAVKEGSRLSYEEFEKTLEVRGDYYQHSYELYFPLYENYTATKAFLKRHRLYLSNEIKPEEIAYITVNPDVPYIPYQMMTEEMTDYEASPIRIKDPALFPEILKGAAPLDTSSDFWNYQLIQGNPTISVTLKQQVEDGDEFSSYSFYYPDGNIPAELLPYREGNQASISEDTSTTEKQG